MTRSQGNVMSSDKSTLTKRCKESISDFSARLYAQLYQTQDNVFFSPLSIATCLQMVYHGSKGNTKQQCADVMGTLGIGDTDLLSFYQDLIAQLNSADQDTKLSIANKAWIKDTFTVLDSYKNMLQEQLDTDIARHPFSDPVEAANEVNGWVKDKTQGIIEKLIDPSLINDLTRLILCNAIYFKGLWHEPFDVSETEKFHVNAKETVDVTMMRHHSDKSLMYGENSVARFVSLPYRGNKSLSMMVILPQVPYQLRQVEEELVKPGKIDEWFKSLGKRDVNLKLPKFKFEEQYDLKEILCKMGITDMFNMGAADFSGINGDPKDLYVSSAVHKAVVSVDEKGTEAAAATGMIMMTRCAMIRQPKPRVVFHVDQPFAFLIANRKSLLFAGRLLKPQ